jgi:hypothetical protein
MTEKWLARGDVQNCGRRERAFCALFPGLCDVIDGAHRHRSMGTKLERFQLAGCGVPPMEGVGDRKTRGLEYGLLPNQEARAGSGRMAASGSILTFASLLGELSCECWTQKDHWQV